MRPSTWTSVDHVSTSTGWCGPNPKTARGLSQQPGGGLRSVCYSSAESKPKIGDLPATAGWWNWDQFSTSSSCTCQTAMAKPTNCTSHPAGGNWFQWETQAVGELFPKAKWCQHWDEKLGDIYSKDIAQTNYRDFTITTSQEKDWSDWWPAINPSHVSQVNNHPIITKSPTIWRRLCHWNHAPGAALVTARVRLAMATPHGSRVPQLIALVSKLTKGPKVPATENSTMKIRWRYKMGPTSLLTPETLLFLLKSAFFLSVFDDVINPWPVASKVEKSTMEPPRFAPW